FTTVFAYSEDTVAMHDSTGVRNISCQIVSGSFFTALGVGPLYGRTLTVADEVRASDALPAVLDYSFWNRNFAGDSGAVGKQFILQSRVFAIVGVMPRGFHGVQVESGPDVYIPLIAAERLFNDPDRNSYRKLGYTLLARVRLGVTLAAARAEAE